MTAEGVEKELAEAKEDMLENIAKNPRLAHEFLFEHRHPNETPFFHGEISIYDFEIYV